MARQINNGRILLLVVAALLIAVPLLVELPGWWGALPFAAGAALLGSVIVRAKRPQQK